MSRLARVLIAGTSAAMLTSALTFAEPINNDQDNDEDVVARTVQRVDNSEAVTGLSVAQANSATGEVMTGSTIDSTQARSGDVRARTITEANNVWAVATGHSAAQGNALTLSAADDAELDAVQTGAPGTISALSALRLGEYAGHAVQTAQAASNAIQVSGSDAAMDLRVSQSSGANVDARARIEASTAEIETSLAVATAAGNSVNTAGSVTDTILELDQTNSGRVRSRAEADIANADHGATAASQAAGNTATVRNEWGYAHIQGQQLNEGDVQAMTRLGVGAFENGALVGSANAVGNEVLLSNFGADAYAGVGQVNTGNVRSQVTVEGGWGNSAFATSSAIGNAQSGYICSECPVGLTANTSQTNTGAVHSGVNQTHSSYVGAVTGSATAVGNASTFATRPPGG